MKTPLLTTFTAGVLLALPASAATIVTSLALPAAGDYASDASSGVTTGSQLQVADNRGFVGQSFTLGMAGDADYLFNSITFLIQDQGEITESTQSLGLHIFQGIPELAGSTELIEVQFSGTFDATAGNYVTFALTATESATLGALTAGTEYAAVLRPDQDEVDGGSQFRIVRSDTNANPYSGGTAIFGGDRVGNNGADAQFQVNVTEVIPEPSSVALLACGFVGLAVRRRRS